MLQIYQLSQQKTRKELIKENPIAFKAFLKMSIKLACYSSANRVSIKGQFTGLSNCLYAIGALILSQCQCRLIYPEDLPCWLTLAFGYERTGRLIKTWLWGVQNADDSDEAKPWDPVNSAIALGRINPAYLDF